MSVTASHFVIYGQTNVNTFECEMDQRYASDPIMVKSLWSKNRITFEGLKLRFPLNDFDCGVEAMSNDLKETLKSDSYPYLYLQINYIQIKEGKQEIEKLSVVSSIDITLAGVSKKYEIKNGNVINHSESSLTLTGHENLDMTDFKIDPPVKFWGMVKVDSQLSVGFEIKMEVINL
ncbi:hypothetical protein N6H18_01210 [Reichenbachiella agarivorans]|uniref:YceI-like domain-containing protein n=1 Tax=Reichenbachiella agarivorans TaxID=2979464 RepID=A0ABY6CPZ1_9BACT|nr:hypothetical protein [Reichenbachiella agarivorans]UXP32589.1 hypothetical protein N6H18_01210 [Reichenbachiella agarivorans]